MLLSILITVAVPNVVPTISSLRSVPSLTIITHGNEQRKIVPAKLDDIKLGSATFVGEPITKVSREEPTGIYFENVVHTNESDPHSKLEGSGMFRFQIWIIGLTGMDLTTFSKAGLSRV